MARAISKVSDIQAAFFTDLQSRVSHLETQLGGAVSDITAVGRELKGIRTSQDALGTKVDALIVAVTTLQATKPAAPLESLKSLISVAVSMATLFAIVVGGILWLNSTQPVQRDAQGITARELAEILNQRAELPNTKRPRQN